MHSNSTGLKAIILAAIFLAFATARSFAADCIACLSHLEAISAKKQELKESQELLDRNRRYLASISAESASKFLKVESNVYQILKKIDAVKAEHTALEKKYADAGCDQCYHDDL